MYTSGEVLDALLKGTLAMVHRSGIELVTLRLQAVCSDQQALKKHCHYRYSQSTPPLPLTPVLKSLLADAVNKMVPICQLK